MKEVVHNKNNIEETIINRIVRRAKIIIENDKQEILLAHAFNNYQLPGGHLEDEETFEEGLKREVLEETGIEINTAPTLVMSIIYMTKDIPIEGINSKYIGNYYSIKTNEIPNLSSLDLTSEEEMGNFKLQYINKKDILNILNVNLNICTHKETVLDTIEVIKEYLKNESN